MNTKKTKVLVRSNYRQLEEYHYLTVIGLTVYLSKRTYRRLSDRLCYAGDDYLVFSTSDGILFPVVF